MDLVQHLTPDFARLRFIPGIGLYHPRRGLAALRKFALPPGQHQRIFGLGQVIQNFLDQFFFRAILQVTGRQEDITETGEGLLDLTVSFGIESCSHALCK